jgi:uncharacterized peroxidase-related enzyme
MAFIKVIHPTQAEGKLKQIYAKVSGPGGQVDHVLQVHSLRPHTLEGHMCLYKTVLHDTRNRLPHWYAESIGVLVSRLNQCEYCDRHHSAGLKRLLRREAKDFDAYDRALSQARPGAPFTEREQAGLAYARKLTHTPGAIEQADIDFLRQAGFSDGEILEVNQVTSYFAYANRAVTGLGVSVDGELLGLSPGDADDPEAWHHG